MCWDGQAELQQGEGGKARFSRLFLLLPAALWAHAALPIALRPLAVCRAAALREASHSSPSDPLFLFLGSLEEYEALGIIRLFQVSLEKEVNRLGEYKESPFL